MLNHMLVSLPVYPEISTGSIDTSPWLQLSTLMQELVPFIHRQVYTVSWARWHRLPVVGENWLKVFKSLYYIIYSTSSI